MGRRLRSAMKAFGSPTDFCEVKDPSSIPYGPFGNAALGGGGGWIVGGSCVQGTTFCFRKGLTMTMIFISQPPS